MGLEKRIPPIIIHEDELPSQMVELEHSSIYYLFLLNDETYMARLEGEYYIFEYMVIEDNGASSLENETFK